MDRRLAQPGFWMSAVLALVVVGLQTVLSTPLVILDVIFDQVLHQAPLQLARQPVIVGCINLVSFGGAIALGLYWNRLPLRRAFPFGRVTLPLVISVALAILGGDILLSELDNAFRALAPPPKWLLEAFKEIFTSEGNLGARVFVLVIVAPVTEELLFRGIILRGLLSRHRPSVAIALAALLFAFVHLNPWQMASAFWLGVCFGWFYWRTGSISICILAHAIANGFFVVFTTLPVEIPGLTGEQGAKVTFQPWWLDLAGAVLLLAGIWGFRKASPQTTEQARTGEASGGPPDAARGSRAVPGSEGAP